MCIAIYSPKGAELSKETLNNCWLNNYNGAGFMYNNNGRLTVVKEMTDFNRFYNKYKKAISNNQDSAFVLHFRISTHGVITKENCHPFLVNNKLGFVHNGVINSIAKDTQKSDTNMFNRLILKKIPDISVEYMNNPAIKELIQAFIGGSKLVFLDNNNNYAIIGEEKGHWDANGIWYSNDSYKEVKQYIDYGGTSVKRYGSYGSGGFSSSNLGGGSRHSSSSGVGFVKAYRLIQGTHTTCPKCNVLLSRNEVVNQLGECMDCMSDQSFVDVAAQLLADGVITEHISSEAKPPKQDLPEKKDAFIDDDDDDADLPVIHTHMFDTCDWCQQDSVTKFEPTSMSFLCESCLSYLQKEGVVKS